MSRKISSDYYQEAATDTDVTIEQNGGFSNGNLIEMEVESMMKNRKMKCFLYKIIR